MPALPARGNVEYPSPAENENSESSAMAKSNKKTNSAARPPDLDKLRAQLGKIDRELVKLINERAKTAVKIGLLKQKTGEAVYQPAREEEVLARAEQCNRGPLPNEDLRAVFRELISGARKLEKSLRVAFLGPAYSYSHLAAMERFGQAVELIPVSSIGAVFEEVNRDHVDFGLVPVENSTDGRVADTLEMFTRMPVRICAEVPLPIHHNLLARCGRNEIEEVYSRPQALSQCRNWLAKHLPRARTIEVTSTSTAAQLANDKPGVAAIASAQAGVHYGLNVVAENIEDNRSNVTRFAVIGQETGERTGDDKTAMMLEVEHRSGALADVINVFKRQKLNLTWIESFPVFESPGEYLFFVEMQGHEYDAKLRRAVAALERKTSRLVILGSYPRMGRTQ